MLVLSRRPGQGIKIGEDIEVVIMDSHSGRIRVGIQAPPEVLILRTELEKKNDGISKRIRGSQSRSGVHPEANL